LNIEPQCIACIFNQAFKVCQNLKLDKQLSKKVLDEAACLVPEFSYDKTPPQNALKMYQNISAILKKEDIYKEIKLSSIKKAKELIPLATKLIEESEDKFLSAVKMAIAGNVIDLASEVEFDLEEEIRSILQKDLSVDDSKSLYKKLKTAKNIAYLGDNAGENEFDKLFMRYIKSFFPDVEIYYFVRSKPIINDITFLDLKDDKELKEVANLIDSGNLTPGMVLEDLNDKAKDCLLSCDIIISKGMGNYECLSNYKLDRLFYLLKVKCEVVANSLKLKVGDIVCKEVI